MSSQSNAIKCFTYDWLIRLFELHPVDKKSFPGFSGGMQLHGFETKLAAISPLFNRIANAYIPHVYDYTGTIINIQEADNPFADYKPVKTIYKTSYLIINNLSSNFITREFIDKRMHLISSTLSVWNTGNLTPDELKYLLPGCYGVYLANITLSETLKFSEIWPLLRYCLNLRLNNVKNLIFDADITKIMKQQPPWVSIDMWDLCGLNVPGNRIEEILEYFLCHATNDSALTLSFSKNDNMDKETEITVSKMLLWLRANKFVLRGRLPESFYFDFESNIVVRKLGPKKVFVFSKNSNRYGYRRHE